MSRALLGYLGAIPTFYFNEVILVTFREAGCSSLICRGSLPLNNNVDYSHAYSILQLCYVINLFIYFCSIKFHLLFFQGLMKNHLLSFFIITWYPKVDLFIILLALYLCITSIGIIGVI